MQHESAQRPELPVVLGEGALWGRRLSFFTAAGAVAEAPNERGRRVSSNSSRLLDERRKGRLAGGGRASIAFFWRTSSLVRVLGQHGPVAAGWDCW